MRNYKSIVFVLCSVAIIGVWSCKTTKPVVEPNKVENIKPAEINEELAMGKKINDTKCATCHKAKNPANYTAAEWQKQVNRMAERAKTTSDENTLLVKYGTSIAKQ
ncbi:MAG: hypothetical protein IPH74_13110 [Bacteroidetes bacterium]|jgi:cytochrome c5|nr:hypothetical protein [Bacteroidota bacterium]MBP7257078.1 hypothetical protein [Chitinophagales bacterium]MBK7139890.1 hypothetical protein [Bacteroidota bacterium]MBK7503617.1 hypothetical protein [Bacteroidota bacterium]MBK7639881.1 hypothetical protein [Bacteroidota bacterium]